MNLDQATAGNNEPLRYLNTWVYFVFRQMLLNIFNRPVETGKRHHIAIALLIIGRSPVRCEVDNCFFVGPKHYGNRQVPFA